MAKKKKKKPVVKKFSKKTSADRPVPRDKKKKPPTRRPVKDNPKKVKKAKPKAKAKPVTKAKKKPVLKAKPVAKPKKRVASKPKAKPVTKAKKKLVSKKRTVAPKKATRKRKEKVAVPPKLGWPPPGTVIQGKVRYVTPQPGDEPKVLMPELILDKPNQHSDGTIIPGTFNGTKKDSNKGVVVTFLKGVEGWPAHLRVTRDEALVVNLYSKTWRGALDQLKTNYGVNLVVPKFL